MLDLYATTKKVTLSNGIDIYLCPWPWPVNFTHISARIHAGRLNDPDGLEGVNHLVEHVVSKVSQLDKYRRYMNMLGVDYSLGTCNNMNTWIDFNLPNANLHSIKSTGYLTKILKLIDDFFFETPNKKQKKAFEMEKKAVINECYYHDRTPEISKLYHQVETYPWGKLLHMKHEYPETVAALTLENMRKYYLENYTTGNMSITICGNIDIDRIIEIINCSPLNQRKATGKNKSLIERAMLGKPKIYQTHLNIREITGQDCVQGHYGTRLFTNDFDFNVMSVAMRALRPAVGTELREKRNWTYTVNSTVSEYGDVREFSLDTKLPPSAINDVEDILNQLIVKVIADEKKIIEAKKLKIADHRITMPTIKGVCKQITSEILFEGRIIPEQESLESLKSITVPEVQKFLQYFSETKNRFTVFSHP